MTSNQASGISSATARQSSGPRPSVEGGQPVGPLLAELLGPDVEVTGAHALSPRSALLRPLVPALQVLGVRGQVGAGLEEPVVELQVQVVAWT
jgi:hypothetical protein